MLVMVLVIVILVGGWLVAYGYLSDSRRADTSRRWARVALRRAPVRRTGNSDYDALLDHVDRQIDGLLSERHRLMLLTQKGERLKGMMQRSPELRVRIPSVERVLVHLSGRATELDALIGKYGRHRDNLRIMDAAAEFSREVEAYESGASAVDPFGEWQLETERLDEERERLFDLAEAEEELNLLLGT